MTTSIILIIISFLVILIALKQLSNVRKISNHGTEVKGIVFNVEQLVGTYNNISYPIVRFLTKENDWVVKSSRIGLIPGIYKKGKEVSVIYQNDNPNNFFIKDKLIYLIPISMLIIASLLTIFGIFFLIQI